MRVRYSLGSIPAELVDDRDGLLKHIRENIVAEYRMDEDNPDLRAKIQVDWRGPMTVADFWAHETETPPARPVEG